MSTESIKQEKDQLEQAMTLLIKVQLGNGNREVEQSLDTITDDLSTLIHNEY